MVNDQFVNSQNFFPSNSINYAGNQGEKFRFQLTTDLIKNDDTPQVPDVDSQYYGVHQVSFNTQDENGNTQQALGIKSNFRMRIGNTTQGKSKVSIKVKLSNIPDGLFVLETDGEDTADEFYYEGNEVFDINGDLHDGNLQNQNTWAFYDNAQNNAYRSSQGLPASQYNGGKLALTSTGGTGLTTAPFSVGDIVNVQQTNLSPTNPQYNGTHTVLEKPDANTIVLDVAFGSATPVEGGSVNADAIVLTNFF